MHFTIFFLKLSIANLKTNCKMEQSITTNEKFLLEKKSHRCCVICDAKLIGRSDKVFCGIQCKNKYHSEVRKSNKTFESETIKVITKNYLILAGVISKGSSASVKKIVLQRLGFNFDHVTQIKVKHTGILYFVYDFCYHFSKNGNIIIHTDDKQMPISPFLFKRWKAILPDHSIPKNNDVNSVIQENIKPNVEVKRYSNNT